MFTTDVRVILAGAGPGDPELLTVKAMRSIAAAEVILYDALVNEVILNHAPASCHLINVGKRSGHHRYSQDEINRMILFYSQRFSRVLRLKGGDPFVLGRGMEQLNFLRSHGVEASIIPGISSAIAGPASAGIPVTQRGISDSFWVITGTTSSGQLSGDLELAARSSATVVILMGLNKLSEIMTLFCSHRPTDEPAAVVFNATLPEQQVVSGTISKIDSPFCGMDISGPGIIIIGKVVARRDVAEIMAANQEKIRVAV